MFVKNAPPWNDIQTITPHLTNNININPSKEDRIMKPVNKNEEKFIASLMPDSDKKMVRIASASFLTAILLCFWATTYEQIVGEVMFEPTPLHEITTTLNLEQKKEEVKKPDPPKKIPTKEEIMRKRPGGGGKQAGKGDPNAALQRGVLEILTAMTNNAAAQAYDLAKKTFSKDMEKRMKELNGLQVTGKTQLAGVRRGKPNAGWNDGVAEGGAGGIGDMLSSLLGGGSGAIKTKAKGHIKEPKVNEIDMGSAGASRSASEIMKVVHQRMSGLRHIYNTHLKKKPGFQGKVTLRFTIAPGGEIINIAIVSSSTGYSEFDNDVKNAVKRWTFSKIKSGNTTVTVPFTFTE